MENHLKRKSIFQYWKLSQNTQVAAFCLFYQPAEVVFSTQFSVILSSKTPSKI